MTDPLEEREEEQSKVQERRLVERLDEDSKRAQLAELLTNEAMRDYLWEVISRCGTLQDAFDSNFGKTGYNCGRQAIGRMIIVDISLAAPRAWLAMQLKAAEVASTRERTEARERSRKGRST